MTTPSPVRRKLAALRRRRRFVPCRESGAFADELRALLDQIGLAAAADPHLGLELLGAFYRCDAAVFGTCDDSNGTIGDVFRMTARDLFLRIARRDHDSRWVADFLFKLLQADDYGVRDHLLAGTRDVLPEPELRRLADRCWQAAGAPPEATTVDARWHRTRWLLLVERLAKELHDAALFERARLAHSPETGVAACMEIASAWLAAGEPATALAWLDRIAPDAAFLSWKRGALLRAVHQSLGNRDEVERLVWQRFRAARSQQTLNELLGVIGVEQRERVLADTIANILQADTLDLVDATFLNECGAIDALAGYMIRHRALLDGDAWPTLLPLAESLEDAGRWLAAVLLYRALLDSILARAQTRTYSHGVRYLRKLDRLARAIDDWDAAPTHAVYVAALEARHGKKSSFWTRYNGAPPYT